MESAFNMQCCIVKNTLLHVDFFLFIFFTSLFIYYLLRYKIFHLDRKKDLVKLAHGEYVSLGKVEATLKKSKYVENCCAYGDSRESFIVLLVVPVQEALQELATSLTVSEEFEDQCCNIDVIDHVLKDIQSSGKTGW